MLLLEPQAASQTLRLSLGAGSPDGSATIEVSLHSPRGKEPSSLQWDTTIPASPLGFPDPIASAGPAALAAGKSVVCAPRDKTGESWTSRCILSGGGQAIQDGVIAVLHLKITRNARRGSYRVSIDHGIAVSKDLKQASLNTVETLVIVRSR